MTRTFLNVQEGCLFFNLFLESQPHRSQPKGVSLPDSNFFFLAFYCVLSVPGDLAGFSSYRLYRRRWSHFRSVCYTLMTQWETKLLPSNGLKAELLFLLTVLVRRAQAEKGRLYMTYFCSRYNEKKKI